MELADSRNVHRIDLKEACGLLLDGYRTGLELKGRPYVLAGEHQWLRDAALAKLKDPARFWRKLEAFAPARAAERRTLARHAISALPAPHGRVRLVHRIAGIGSLGRPRAVAITTWQGGPVAREAKALIASSCAWAAGKPPRTKSFAAQLLERAVRSRDPTLAVRGNAIVRRLAPDGSRVELGDLPRRRDNASLIGAMGLETANVHLGSATPSTLRRALRTLPKNWLADGAQAMLDQVLKDQRAHRRG
jgi:hypothetical protein